MRSFLRGAAFGFFIIGSICASLVPVVLAVDYDWRWLFLYWLVIPIVSGFHEMGRDWMSVNWEPMRQWMPVVEDMPNGAEMFYKQFGEYPEYIVMIEGSRLPTALFFDGEGWFDAANEYYRVTHWMPLPAPPGENNV